MRPTFMASERLRRKARQSLESGLVQIRRWWCEKYNRPSNDPLFLGRSMAEHQQEMIEDLCWRKRELETELATGTSGDTTLAVKQLAAIDKALGEKKSGVRDKLAEKWTEQFMRGEIPDLDEMPEPEE